MTTYSKMSTDKTCSRAREGGIDTLSGIKGINSNPRSWQAWLHGQKRPGTRCAPRAWLAVGLEFSPLLGEIADQRICPIIFFRGRHVFNLIILDRVVASPVRGPKLSLG